MNIPTCMKFSYVVAIAMFVIGFINTDDTMASTAVIVLVVLTCTVEILEAIESKTNQESKQ
jgi:hypothetical protein